MRVAKPSGYMAPTPGQIRKGAGGAPTKYDWPSAAAFMAAYIVDNDPKRAEATKVLEQWFADQGLDPDRRELQRFMAALFKDG